MQRAAATAASKEAQSPASDESPHTPKRQRKSMEHQSPSTPQADLDAIAAAIAAEEQKRQEVIARQAAEAGETHWVLDVPAANSPPPQPQSYVMATESLDVDDDISFGGRRGFGNFKRKIVSLLFCIYCLSLLIFSSLHKLKKRKSLNNSSNCRLMILAVLKLRKPWLI